MPYAKIPCPGNCGRMIGRDQKSCKPCRYPNTQTPIAEDAPRTTGEAFTETGDTALAERTVPARVRSLEQLIKVCEVDTQTWEVERWTCQAQEQTSVPRATRPDGGSKWIRPDNTPVTTTMFHVKAWLKRKTAVIAVRAEIAELKAQAHALAVELPRRAPALNFLRGNDHALELALFDVHMGKLCWAPETGWAHYDTKIAAAMFEEAIESLIHRTSHLDYQRIVFPIGNDLLNADNRENTTTRGTQQTTDGRFQKTFQTAKAALVSGIERLRMIAEVEVVVVPGNHDTLAMWCLGDSLESLYLRTPDVTINNSPNLRKYWQFEKNLICFTHGDKGKRLDYPLLMAREQKDAWAATEHREIHTGHLHQTRVEEKFGVRVRILSSLCPPDSWHAENAFVGQVRASEAFVWHREDGLVMQAIHAVKDR